MKGIIFDMDGVLIDSEPQQFEANIKTLKMFGAEVEYDEFQNFVGMDNFELFKFFRKKYGIKVSAEELLKIKTDIIVKEMKNNLHIMPNFIEMSESLDGLSGVKFAIASSSPRISVDIVIEQLGWKNFLYCSVSGDEVSTAKPSPEIYHKAASLLSIDEKDCLVLEDSAKGIDSALNAGMHVIGYYHKNSAKQDFSKVNHKIFSLEEFPNYAYEFANLKN